MPWKMVSVFSVMATVACFLNAHRSKMEVTGIILAGGKGSRMGSEKGLVHLAGLPMINYAIQVLSTVCKNIIISTSSEDYKSLGYQVVADEIPGIGPMGGIFSALRQSKTEKNLVLSCDMPFVTKELMLFILENAEGFQVAVPWHGNRHYEPLCAFYNIQIVSLLRKFIQEGNYKLPDLFEEIHINKLTINSKQVFFDENIFFNVNSNEDLKAAGMLIKSRKIK